MERPKSQASSTSELLEDDAGQSLDRTQTGRLRRPNLYCRLAAQHPGCMLCVVTFVQTFFVLLTGFLYVHGSDVFPADFTDVPLNLVDDSAYTRVAAWNRRNADIAEPMYKPSFLTPEVARQVSCDVIELFYETKDGSNILTVERLRAILDFENELQNVKDYTKYCLLQNNRCVPSRSLPRVLDQYLGPPLNGSSERTDTVLREILWTYHLDANMRNELRDFTGKSSRFDSKEDVFVSTLRSYVFVSWVVDNSTGTLYTTKEFAKDVVGPLLWKYIDHGLPSARDLRFYYYNGFLYYDYLRTQVIYDLLLAVGSFCFIFSFLWFQTRSLFVSAFGMYSIVTNFFGANLIYRYVCDYRYFGVFHVLSVFIILGIGVDDIFVFFDAWVTTAGGRYPSVSHRLADCYYKASVSMLVTSLNTVISLLVNTFTPLLAIGSFGLFSALLIIVNYMSVISFFPVVVVFYHLKIEKKPFCCQQPRKKNGVSDIPSGILSAEAKFAGSTDAVSEEQKDSTASVHDSLTSSIRSKWNVAQFICKWYLVLVWNPAIQALFLLTTLSLVAFMGFSASKLTVDTQSVKLYRDVHPLGEALVKRNANFDPPYYSHDDLVQVYLVWGMKGADFSHCHHTEFKECNGRVQWDDNFNLNPYHAQRDLNELCITLKGLPRNFAEDKLKIRFTGSKPDIKCFLHDMDHFLQSELRQVVFNSRRPVEGLPTTDEKTSALMMSLPHVYNITAFNEAVYFDRFFETSSLYWLHDGYKGLTDPRRLSIETWRSYAPLLGHSMNSTDLHRGKVANVDVVYGTRLRYAAIVINTTLPRQGVAFGDGLVVFDEWQAFLSRELSHMHPTLHNGYVITPDANDVTGGIWHWMLVQKVLTESAISGIIMSLGLAFPVLVFATGDVLVGALSTFTIACATVCVVGVIPLAGWRLGVLESMNLTLVVGLAIDYIVHVSEGYHLSEETTRRGKVSQVLREVGISVFSGAITTLGASFFLVFAKIVFFMQFGLFIFCTIGFSLFCSMGMLIVILSLIGPETERFSLKNLVYRPVKFVYGGLWNMVTKTKVSPDLEPLASARSAALLTKPAEDVVSVASDDEPQRRQPHVTSSPPESLKSKISIDDDNLSSGYETSSVRHGHKPEVSDVSDVEEESRRNMYNARGGGHGAMDTIAEESLAGSRAHSRHSRRSTEMRKVATNKDRPHDGDTDDVDVRMRAVPYMKVGTVDAPLNMTPAAMASAWATLPPRDSLRGCTALLMPLNVDALYAEDRPKNHRNQAFQLPPLDINRSEKF